MRDDFDLHAGSLGQAGDLDGGTCGEILREILRVNFIHAGEVRQVGQEDGGLHDVRKSQPLVVEDGLDILEDAVGLDFDVADDEAAVLGIERNLASAEQQVADAHGVVVGADGGG